MQCLLPLSAGVQHFQEKPRHKAIVGDMNEANPDSDHEAMKHPLNVCFCNILCTGNQFIPSPQARILSFHSLPTVTAAMIMELMGSQEG